jgi:SWI/SNF-related matrix-associated actin-dependent regulator of chromatin subfamily A member 5
MAAMLASAVESCTNAWWQLDLTYTSGKGRIYTQEEDQFILCTTHQIGYGNWDRLKQEIRRSWQFRFDWFLKSRTPQELGRRCDTLIKMLEKVRSTSCPQRGPVRSDRGLFLFPPQADTQASRGRKVGKKGNSTTASAPKRARPTPGDQSQGSSAHNTKRRKMED